MTAVFKIAEGRPCRACGAVLGPISSNGYDLCGNCWTSVKMSCGVSVHLSRKDDGRPVSSVTQADVNSWLAGKLLKDLKRLTNTGMVGRCEAVSGWGYGNPGAQCAKSATLMRDGHKVCGKHHGATAPVYVGDDSVNYYSVCRDIMVELAGVDGDFADVVRQVAARFPA